MVVKKNMLVFNLLFVVSLKAQFFNLEFKESKLITDCIRTLNPNEVFSDKIPKERASGFKHFNDTSLGKTGNFAFHNIEFKELKNKSSLSSLIVLPNTPKRYLKRKHPRIWTSYRERQKIVENIHKYSWAKSLYKQYIERQKKSIRAHRSNPSAFLATIPNIPGDRTIHRKKLDVAVECGILYFLTDKDEYAQLAADILYNYVKKISVEDPLNIQFYTPRFNWLIMTREHFPRIGMAYDFIQPFLVQKGTTVFDTETKNRVPFNFLTSQKAFEVMTESVLQVGGLKSNHSTLELSGALYNVICMEDDETREHYFSRLWNGDKRQDGITWMIDHFTKEESIWPEAAGYSKFTHSLFIQLMNVIDRYKPELKIIDNNLDIVRGIFMYENQKYPNGAVMAYGDIGRQFNKHDFIFRNVLAIADRKGLDGIKQRAATTLKKLYKEQGGYKPKVKNQRLEWYNPLQLLWGVAIEDTVSDKGENLESTITVKHAGIVMQRNYSGVNDVQNGLMYYTGGGTYVHAHATGLDMEIYGAGYVIGPDYGSDTYGTDIHETYAVSYAAHNTIITNGASGRGSKTKGNSTWQNIVDPIVLQACEPKVKEKPIAKDFMFSIQFLDDKINNVAQQRTNSIIRTSPVSGYYLDVFRSLSSVKNEYHDYLFHGLGDTTTITNPVSKAVDLAATPGRFATDVGDKRAQPGWKWFNNVTTSALTKEAIRVKYSLKQDSKYLHINVPSGVDREYSLATAPPSKQVKNGYDKKDTRVFVMRKYGEAWSEPFIAVYEPSARSVSTIKSVKQIYHKNKVIGVEVVSVVKGEKIRDVVILNDEDDSNSLLLANYDIVFTGRFAIVRTKRLGDNTYVSLYIGDGSKLMFNGKTLETNTKKGFLEYKLEDIN